MWINCSAIVWGRFNFECFPYERTRAYFISIIHTYTYSPKNRSIFFIYGEWHKAMPPPPLPPSPLLRWQEAPKLEQVNSIDGWNLLLVWIKPMKKHTTWHIQFKMISMLLLLFCLAHLLRSALYLIFVRSRSLSSRKWLRSWKLNPYSVDKAFSKPQ